MLLAVKILQTLFVCILVPVYWWYYGPQNFLWISDTALIVGTLALWLDSSLLASVEALSVFVFELAWAVDILLRLIAGNRFLTLSAYMFKAEIPLRIRLLSLFHVWMPWLLLWMVMRFGYDGRALVVQTIVWWIVVLASYFVSTRQENMNLVFGVAGVGKYISPVVYLAIIMVVVPLGIYLPTHFFLHWIAPSPRV
jgi:hypothetical protein